VLLSAFSQQLFLVSKKSGDKTEASVEVGQEPMADNALRLVGSCVQAQVAW
jgi:hypothetical protein